MTETEVVVRLRRSGLPVACECFPSKQTGDYLVYCPVKDETLHADNSAYFTVEHYRIELYTHKRSRDVERRVEAELEDLSYGKDYAYIETEHMHMTIYEI